MEPTQGEICKALHYIHHMRQLPTDDGFLSREFGVRPVLSPFLQQEATLILTVSLDELIQYLVKFGFIIQHESMDWGLTRAGHYELATRQP